MAMGASSRASSPPWLSVAGVSAAWALRSRRLAEGFGAGVTFAAGRVLVLVTRPVFSAPSPTDQNAHPLQAFSVIAVPTGS